MTALDLMTYIQNRELHFMISLDHTSSEATTKVKGDKADFVELLIEFPDDQEIDNVLITQTEVIIG